ncbi:MAG: protein TolQ [Desulfobacteraceae bacterium]|nr:protein TolQ [Desulfobacteraceae bacterium]
MQDLSIVSMFLNAGLIVKCVMLLLMTFSIGSWYIIFMKFIIFKRVRQDSESFLENFWRSKNLAEAAKSAQKTPTSPEAQIFIAGFSELQKISKSKSPSDANDTFEMRMAGMDNLKRALEKAATTESERLGRALSFLATTGSATPFIGLFGTVWGIMSSFQDIGQKGGASLAVVAPGISEALVATAAGLAVAIPSVIFFNYFTAKIADTENDMQRFSTDFLNLVERDLIAKL